MPDLTVAEVLAASRPDRPPLELETLLGPGAGRLRVGGTRLQPPICHWTVYRAESGHRVTFKTFFSAGAYADYADQLSAFYPDRLADPRHPAGGVVLLPRLNGVAWRYPFDPAMAGLSRCLDGAWAARALGRKEAVRPEPLQYRPEIGALLTYREPRCGRLVAYGKVAPHTAVGMVWLVLDRLWRSLARRAGLIRLARPLAYRPEAGLLLQAPVAGQPVGRDRNRAVFRDLVHAAAQGLAVVHGADIPFGPRRGIEELVLRLQRGLADVALTAPELYGSLRRLVDQLERRAGRSRSGPAVPSHGDFKYDQLLARRDGFVLLDFELFCQAEPDLDVGTFCAYLPNSTPRDWREGAAAELLRAAHAAGMGPHDLASLLAAS